MVVARGVGPIEGAGVARIPALQAKAETGDKQWRILL